MTAKNNLQYLLPWQEYSDYFITFFSTLPSHSPPPSPIPPLPSLPFLCPLFLPLLPPPFIKSYVTLVDWRRELVVRRPQERGDRQRRHLERHLGRVSAPPSGSVSSLRFTKQEGRRAWLGEEVPRRRSGTTARALSSGPSLRQSE